MVAHFITLESFELGFKTHTNFKNFK